MNCVTATERQRTVRAVNVSDIKISVVQSKPTSQKWGIGLNYYCNSNEKGV